MQATHLRISQTKLSKLIKIMNHYLIDSSTQRIKLYPASFYAQFSQQHIQLWCHATARYTIPTVELVDFLKAKINGRKAIEIGSGNGDLGYHLGIPETDSYIQQTDTFKLLYWKLKQYPTNPKKEAEKLEALEALEKYSPEVVVGSWITQKYDDSKERLSFSEKGSSIYGVDDEKVIRLCDYIHVGNESVHGGKFINQFPHETVKLEGYLSRSQSPEKNIIQIWRKQCLK